MIALLLAACGGGSTFIVEGTVVEIRRPSVVVLDHEDIPGLMDAMTMPFDVADPSMLDGLDPGDRVVARYVLGKDGGHLTRLRVTGQGVAPEVVQPPAPVRVGETLPAVTLATQDGGTRILGPAQTDRVVLTFIYTRCPDPAFCPAMMGRLQALDAALAGAEGVAIVAVTLDPAHDTPEILSAYGAGLAMSPRFVLARAPDLPALAMSAGLPVVRTPDSFEIAHGLRLLVLDRGGVLLERYDDARFPLDRVVRQLTTGGPAGDPSQSGTVTPPEE